MYIHIHFAKIFSFSLLVPTNSMIILGKRTLLTYPDTRVAVVSHLARGGCSVCCGFCVWCEFLMDSCSGGGFYSECLVWCEFCHFYVVLSEYVRAHVDNIDDT
jgi:hypothetical protein